ncbi:MAG: chromosome segregation protein SMC [Gemmataceae bacterium]|nr:chromosome segregation protein SMC [Gemmataceae bacterium]MDW8266739.1 chromosome segregation protein SMC [Gemmataceae bacterium]
MLKRLELVGFKSFADKTQFEFPRGITAIVGPNGSGKSNIVDAVRWILGEQSAKSLRGGEMADVIFNGSASRRSFGMAEVTLTFDNQRRSLPIDADEVQITRRVYRTGEGEYLINHQPSRLKDIKQLFLGSGVGLNAYCIIEQGRVDVLLQASPKERRVIFEEAAGISRFKAKKIETLRKLERVEQNVQRLRDIIDEVDKQLRNVKLQAAKAQRYQEYSGRLQELRVGLGLQEYHELTLKLDAERAVLEELRGRLAEEARRAEWGDEETRRLDQQLADVDDAARAEEARLARVRQQIAAAEGTLSHERQLVADLEANLAETRGRLSDWASQVATLLEAAAQAAEEIGRVEQQCQVRRQAVRVLEDELKQVVHRLAELQKQVQADKNEHLEQMRLAARWQNDAVSYKAQLDNVRRERERLRLKSAQATEQLASLDVELQELAQADEVLQTRLTEARQTLADQRQARDRLQQQAEAAAQRLADLKAQRSGLLSRIDVLQDLERRREGLGAGVREMLELLEQAAGPWRTVVGMVADLLTVRRRYAPLVDLALGERAQRFVVRDLNELAVALSQRRRPFAGRVTFTPMTFGPRRSAPSEGNGKVETLLSAFPTARRLAEVVSCDHPELTDLAEQLLGKTVCVPDLATARRMQQVERQTVGDGSPTALRYVTEQGELLEADGTLTVGDHHAETGILSRKSELRELRQQLAELDDTCQECEGTLAQLREQAAEFDRRLGELREEIDVLTEQATDLRSRLTQRRQQREGLHEEVVLSRSEIQGLEQELTTLEARWRQAKADAELAEQQVQVLHARLEQADREIRERDQWRVQRQQECTAAQVALAQVEERLRALRARQEQVENDLEQRRAERARGEQHLAASLARIEESQRIMLEASAELARGYLEKESAEANLARLLEERDRLRAQRQTCSERSQAARAAWQAEQQRAHERELAVNDLRHRRDSVAERLRDDYHIDLADLYRQWRARDSTGDAAAASRPVLDPAATQEEIDDLRRKLSRLGSVNLDSLQELAELEARATSLQTQFDDLTSAQRSLQEIIDQINRDSRRLFTESFQAIRGHFQELFRKLFGGGMADIVLEDENDVLESGVEVVAKPPGKELRSISLMSGGEKTLTAVALLLAIFRSKPSPFCLLDEVDAALDEANIGRFTAVLREFLDQSQFIIVTHSRRTMACADVLYGITMQESGISKRVAVRFEDWPDESRNGTASEGPAMEEAATGG